MQFRVNNLESNTVDFKNTLLWYSIGSQKAKVRIENGSKISFLLHTSVEIIVITQKYIEDMGLAMRRARKLDLMSHTDHSRSFFGLCSEIEVGIRGLRTRHPIFVVNHGDYNLVLG